MHAAVQHVEATSGQLVEYLQDLVRIPTVNPPGDHYEELCLYAMERLRQMDCAVDLVHVPQTCEDAGTAHPPNECSVIDDLTGTTRVLVQVELTRLS